MVVAYARVDALVPSTPALTVPEDPLPSTAAGAAGPEPPPQRLHLVCVAGGPHADPAIIDHFVAHYRDRVGVTDFHFFLHQGCGLQERLEAHGIHGEPFAEFTELKKQEAFNRTIDDLGQQWCLTADLDEFQDYGGRFFDQLPSGPWDHVFGVLVDRFALNGFPKLTSAPLGEQFPLRAAFTRVALKALDAKVLAVKGVHVMPGHHRCLGRSGTGPVPVEHFKWDASVLLRLAEPRGNAYSDREAARFRALLAGGRMSEAIRHCLLPALARNEGGWYAGPP